VSLETTTSIRFGDFLLDPSAGGLFRFGDDGRRAPVSLGSRALDVLCVLAGRQGELVTKQAIMDAVWPDTVVEDNNLTVQISALRRVLDQGRAEGSCIQTLPGRGYRFIGPAPEEDADRRGGGAIAALPEGALSRPDQAESPSRPLTRMRLRLAACGMVAALLLAGSWWTLYDVTLAITSAPKRPVADSPEDRRLSVIVLPFQNTSGDASQDSLAASVTRDVTNAIAGYRNTVPLVPEQAAVAYQGKPLDLHAIRQAHSVHFAVTGSVRRENGRLIVSVTVFDTKDDRPVWSPHFDQDDQKDEYNRIVHFISDGFEQAAIDAEAVHATQEHPDELDKRDLMIASRASSLIPVSKEHYLTKMSLVDRALALDPNYVWALRSSARLNADFVMTGYSTDPQADLARALIRVDRALELSPNDVMALREKSRVLRAQGDLEGAEAVIHKLLEINPLSAYRYFDLGIIRLIRGHPDEMLTNMLKAKQLATSADDRESIDSLLAVALLANGRFAEAIPQARLAAAEFSRESGLVGERPSVTLIAAEYLSGDEQQARADLQHFLATPRTMSNLAAVQADPTLAHTPKLVDALHHAGMPEQ